MPPDDPLAAYRSALMREARRYAMPATVDAPTWQRWRRRLRARLRQHLALPAQRRAPRWSIAATTLHDGYRRSLISFAGASDEDIPAWLLTPAVHDAPRPAVIAVPGHGYGMNELVGLTAEGAPRATPQGYHQDFALDLARHGMVVLVPELRGFGRRRLAADRDGASTRSSCEALARWSLLLGRPLLGDRVADVLGAFELLRGIPQVDARRIAIMGGSGGGAVALLAAALEPRLRAAVIGTYFCTFRDSLLDQRHCLCNYVPGLLRDAEMCDIAALIAPRPLLLIAGTDDPLFPAAGTRAAYAELQHAYRIAQAGERLALDLFAGGHQLRVTPALPFLARWLEV
ncbi:alpha/beta hydrolase family protein [Kallotenue papyrolyticum]|uniref:alpha/beta hydrolase family protein n=1 Tax=Kallotenue papyrolyticum TaxID=1325125 RepID=UPI0004785EA2|nr:acetylxylan esterase [Kallotenue papyrolyticum]